MIRNPPSGYFFYLRYLAPIGDGGGWLFHKLLLLLPEWRPFFIFPTFSLIRNLLGLVDWKDGYFS